MIIGFVDVHVMIIKRSEFLEEETKDRQRGEMRQGRECVGYFCTE